MENLGLAKRVSGLSTPPPLAITTNQPPTKVLSNKNSTLEAAAALKPLTTATPPVIKSVRLEPTQALTPTQIQPLSVPPLSVPTKTVSLSRSKETEPLRPVSLQPTSQPPTFGRNFASTPVPPERLPVQAPLDPAKESTSRPLRGERRVVTIRDL